MSGYFGPDIGDAWAPIYDQLTDPLAPDSPEICKIASLSPAGGHVLEYGVGTGRVPAALTELGYRITGIDISSEMLSVLAERHLPRVVAVQQSFVEPIEGKFDCVIALFNTLLYVETQEEQTQAFINAECALVPGGVFIVEMGSPFRPVLGGNHLASSVPYAVSRKHTHVLHTIHDPVTQILQITHSISTESGVRLVPADCRYLWPSEMALMARIAGLSLEEQSGDWHGSSLTAHSSLYVGVFRKPWTD